MNPGFNKWQFSGRSETELIGAGPWWLNWQRYETAFGVFYGLKIGPIAIYIRWNYKHSQKVA